MTVILCVPHSSVPPPLISLFTHMHPFLPSFMVFIWSFLVWLRFTALSSACGPLLLQLLWESSTFNPFLSGLGGIVSVRCLYILICFVLSHGLTLWPRLTSNLPPSYLSLPSTRIISMCHHTWFWFFLPSHLCWAHLPLWFESALTLSARFPKWPCLSTSLKVISTLWTRIVLFVCMLGYLCNYRLITCYMVTCIHIWFFYFFPLPASWGRK